MKKEIQIGLAIGVLAIMAINAINDHLQHRSIKALQTQVAQIESNRSRQIDLLGTNLVDIIGRVRFLESCQVSNRLALLVLCNEAMDRITNKPR